MNHSKSGPRMVALGGGHGLYATLSALRLLGPDVTAVVTVADDGGSSGRLRTELSVIPPGDLRMAISALLNGDVAAGRAGCNDGRAPTTGTDDSAELDGNGEVVLPRTVAVKDNSQWASVLQHRFGGSGALAGHPVGNLLIAGLTEVTGDPVRALDNLMALFGAPGRVLPMSTVPLEIEADVFELETDPRMSRCIRGQVAVATTPGKVRRVRLLPNDPPAAPEVIDAIAGADLITLGPGSWFSSVIPHVLVPGQLAALRASSARKVLIVNLVPEVGETPRYSLERHLRVLSAHAPDFRVDDVIVDVGAVPGGRDREYVEKAAAEFGAVLRVEDVAVTGESVHDPAKLARVVSEYVRN